MVAAEAETGALGLDSSCLPCMRVAQRWVKSERCTSNIFEDNAP